MRYRRPERPCPLHADRIHELRAKYFEFRVAGHRERRHALERHLRRPGLGRVAEQRELDRWPVVHERDVRIDSGDECRGDRAGVGCVARPLRVHVAAVCEQPGESIPGDVRRAEDLCEPPFADSPPQIHLKESVLRGDEPLGEEEVVLRLRVDVRHAPPIASHFDRAVQTGDVELPVDLRQARVRESPELGRASLRGGHAERKDEHQEELFQRG